MTSYKIAVLEGDGIGPEITQEAIKILKFVGSRNQIEFELNYAPFGAAAYFSHGHPFPVETKKICECNSGGKWKCSDACWSFIRIKIT